MSDGRPAPDPRATRLAYVFLAVGLGAISFSAIFTRLAGAPGATTGVYRMGTAVVVLAPLFVRRWRRRGRLPRAESALALVAGAFFGSDLVFWQTGVLISGATTPTLLGNTAPIWVGLGAMYFFREKLSATFWTGLLLALAGALIILGVDAAADVGLGSLFGLVAGFFYSIYMLITQRVRRTLDTLTFFWLAAVGSTLVLLMYALLLGQPLGGFDRPTLLYLLALGLIPQVIGHFSLSFSLGALPASFVAPASLVQPVATALLAAPLLGERLTPLQIAGAAVVLAGIYTVHRGRLTMARMAAAVPAVVAPLAGPPLLEQERSHESVT